MTIFEQFVNTTKPALPIISNVICAASNYETIKKSINNVSNFTQKSYNYFSSFLYDVESKLTDISNKNTNSIPNQLCENENNYLTIVSSFYSENIQPWVDTAKDTYEYYTTFENPYKQFAFDTTIALIVPGWTAWQTANYAPLAITATLKISEYLLPDSAKDTIQTLTSIKDYHFSTLKFNQTILSMTIGYDIYDKYIPDSNYITDLGIEILTDLNNYTIDLDIYLSHHTTTDLGTFNMESYYNNVDASLDHSLYNEQIILEA